MLSALCQISSDPTCQFWACTHQFLCVLLLLTCIYNILQSPAYGLVEAFGLYAQNVRNAQKFLSHPPHPLQHSPQPIAELCVNKKAQLSYLKAREMSMCNLGCRSPCRIQLGWNFPRNDRRMLGSFFLHPSSVTSGSAAIVNHLFVNLLKICFSESCLRADQSLLLR